MEHLIIPENYSSALNLHDTQIGIKTVKDFFQSLLVRHLNLCVSLLRYSSIPLPA